MWFEFSAEETYVIIGALVEKDTRLAVSSPGSPDREVIRRVYEALYDSGVIRRPPPVVRDRKRGK